MGMQLLTGDIWQQAPPDDKVAFVWGVCHVITLENALMKKLPSLKVDNFSAKAAEGLAGGAIGHSMDKQEREFKQELAASQSREQDAIMQGVQREKDAIILTFKSDVLFDTGSSTIKPGVASSGEIDRVAQILNRYPDTTIKVVGYTDSTGAESQNQQLSELRANSVKNALVVKGVTNSRLTTIGMGESNPVADNTTPEGRQLNRRVAIVIEPV